MPENRAAGNENLPAIYRKPRPASSVQSTGDFYLASPHHLRNNPAVKIKILLLVAALGMLFTSGCISINH